MEKKDNSGKKMNLKRLKMKKIGTKRERSTIFGLKIEE